MSTLTQIPFFTDDITLSPHTATKGKWIGRQVSIAEFAADARKDGYNFTALYLIEDTGEYVVKAISKGRHFQFIEGVEVA